MLTNAGVVHRNCCDPPSEVYNVYDDDWDGSVEWIYQLFDAAFEVPGERMPRIKEIEQLYIPGLMTANKRLRTYWGKHMRHSWGRLSLSCVMECSACM
jgi:hypothetical protein